MVSAALNGELNEVKFTPHPIFKVLVPESMPNVPSEILNPENTWSDHAAYCQQANKLAKSFQENFQRFQIEDPDILNAGPQIVEF